MKSKKCNTIKILKNAVKALIMPVAVYLIFTAVTVGRFGSWAVIVTVLRTTVVPMLIAMAMSMPMIMGMWDFSAGAVVYAAAILGANVAAVTKTGVLGLCVSAMLIALLLTAFSGVLYNRMKIPSLVLTLGLVIVYESFPRLIVETGCGLIAQKDGYLAQAPWCFILFLNYVRHLLRCVQLYGVRAEHPSDRCKPANRIQCRRRPIGSKVSVLPIRWNISRHGRYHNDVYECTLVCCLIDELNFPDF